MQWLCNETNRRSAVPVWLPRLVLRQWKGRVRLKDRGSPKQTALERTRTRTDTTDVPLPLTPCPVGLPLGMANGCLTFLSNGTKQWSRHRGKGWIPTRGTHSVPGGRGSSSGRAIGHDRGSGRDRPPCAPVHGTVQGRGPNRVRRLVGGLPTKSHRGTGVVDWGGKCWGQCVQCVG